MDCLNGTAVSQETAFMILSGQAIVQTALSGAFEALLVRQDRGFMRSELRGIYGNMFYAEAEECQANTYDDKTFLFKVFEYYCMYSDKREIYSYYWSY